MRSLLTTCCAALLALAWGSSCLASITYDASVSVLNVGLVSAEVDFTAVNGGVQVTVTNTETNTTFKAQAISSLSFQVGSSLVAPSLTNLSGLSGDPKSTGGLFNKKIQWMSQSGKAFSDSHAATGSGPYTIDHWSFGATSSSVNLASDGKYLILPSSGRVSWPTSLVSDLVDKKSEPYIIGPATFFLTMAGVTQYTNLDASNIKDVQVGFGTDPDILLPTKLTSLTPLADPPAVPEPSTLAIAGLGALGLIGYGLRRRRTK